MCSQAIMKNCDPFYMLIDSFFAYPRDGLQTHKVIYTSAKNELFRFSEDPTSSSDRL